MPYIKRDKEGKLVGWTKWPNKKLKNHEFLPEDHPEIVEYNKPEHPNIAKRRKAQGSTEQQLDYIYRNSIAAWKTKRKAIDDKYPLD